MEGFLFTFFLVIAGIGIYVMFKWGMDEYNCQTPNYMFKCIPSYWVYLGVAILVSFLAVWLYAKIVSKKNSASLIVTYYIAIVVGIVIVSWLLFSHKPTKMQWIGIGLVILGLIIYAYFDVVIEDNIIETLE